MLPTVIQSLPDHPLARRLILAYRRCRFNRNPGTLGPHMSAHFTHSGDYLVVRSFDATFLVESRTGAILDSVKTDYLGESGGVTLMEADMFLSKDNRFLFRKYLRDFPARGEGGRECSLSVERFPSGRPLWQKTYPNQVTAAITLLDDWLVVFNYDWNEHRQVAGDVWEDFYDLTIEALDLESGATIEIWPDQNVSMEELKALFQKQTGRDFYSLNALRDGFNRDRAYRADRDLDNNTLRLVRVSDGKVLREFRFTEDKDG